MNKIALTAGHDRYGMGGACRNGICENKFWNDFLDEIWGELNARLGENVKRFHRPNQRKVGGYHAAMRIQHGEIDKWNARIDVELHFNAAPKAKGHEVVSYTGSKGGQKVAEVFDRNFDLYLNNPDRNIKHHGKGERGSFGLRVGRSWSVITEPFFAKEIDRFKPGGDLRESLKTAFIQSIVELARM